MNRTYKLALFPLVILAFLIGTPHEAQAAKVINLSDTVQTIELRNGDSFSKLEIQPNANWSVQEIVVLRYKGQEYRLNENEEYAIWNDGSFGPQRSNTRGPGSSNNLR